ncbi:MAG: Fur family transcriptional regulator, partial [bacterium]
LIQLTSVDPKSLKAVLGQARTIFASKGLRFTKQREALTTLIFRNSDHFRPEDLIPLLRKSDGAASRATIYRTILLLVESGMLREISLGGGERLYDPNFLQSPHHNHLICVDCREIIEFEDPNIDVMQNCITRRLGFSPTQKALRIEASCDRLRLLGSCKNFKVGKGPKGARKRTSAARSSSRAS